MKRSRSIYLLTLMITLTLLPACKKKEAEGLPKVTTSEIDNIQISQARAGGCITSDGNSSITARGIYWGTYKEPLESGKITNIGTGGGTFTTVLDSLQPGETYYVQAFATNRVGTNYGEVVSFVTETSAPEIKDLISYVQTTIASFSAYVNAMSLPTLVTFEYGLTTNYGNSVQDSLYGTYFALVRSDTVSVHPGNLYHFRIKAENAMGISYSDDKTFTTPGWPPTIKNETVTGVSMTGIKINAQLTTGSLITSVIIHYGTTENLGDSVFVMSVSEGSWPNIDLNKIIEDLLPGTRYYFRITVRNPVATVDSKILSFTTYDMTDVDNNLYHSIKIGSQYWMQENLKALHYQNGDPIAVVPFADAWINTTEGALTYYDYDLDLEKIYGCLYNYYVVGDPRNICPVGWHVPSKDECITLLDYAGGQNVAGTELLGSSGVLDWYGTAITNSTGFTALPAGIRLSTGDYWGQWGSTTFWTSTSFESDVQIKYAMRLYAQPAIDFVLDIQNAGFSIRCLKNQ
jgi:uncharacterized protein (TIGR02145 family)